MSQCGRGQIGFRPDAVWSGLAEFFSRHLSRGKFVHHFGSTMGFLFFVAVALAAFVILYFFMKETRDEQFLNQTKTH